MAPAGTLLLFLCTASALLRPALLSSGTDVSFLDRTLLEKDIAAVFNKVSHFLDHTLLQKDISPVSNNVSFHCCSMERLYFNANCKYTVGLQRRCNIAYFCHFSRRELHTSCQ